MKKSLCILLFIGITLFSFSQKAKTGKQVAKPVTSPTLSKNDALRMKLMVDTLKDLSWKFTGDTVLDERKRACYAFIPKLVAALKMNNSFYYHFDSLETIAQVYPKDSSFRILTWQLYFTVPMKIPAAYTKANRDTVWERPVVRYYGVIQMRSKEMKIFPLYDVGDTLAHGSQQILGASNWWGQLYYNIIQKTYQGKTYYTTFGYEAADHITRRKIIDVLTFDKAGKPHFGAPIFYFKYDSLEQKKDDTLTRFFMEYKWSAQTVLNYDAQMQMIVFDHVAPPSEKAKGATFTYVPDGTYEGFEWLNDHWQWKEKVFTFSIDEDDNPPIPAPLFGRPTHQPELPKDGDPR